MKRVSKQARPNIIYLASCEHLGLLKIGCTSSVSRRMRQLSADRQSLVECLSMVSGSILQEKRLHDRFEPLRVTGEWYRDDSAIIDFFESIVRGEETSGLYGRALG